MELILINEVFVANKEILKTLVKEELRNNLPYQGSVCNTFSGSSLDIAKKLVKTARVYYKNGAESGQRILTDVGVIPTAIRIVDNVETFDFDESAYILAVMAVLFNATWVKLYETTDFGESYQLFRRDGLRWSMVLIWDAEDAYTMNHNMFRLVDGSRKRIAIEMGAACTTDFHKAFEDVLKTIKQEGL